MSKHIMPLTDLQVKNAKPKEKNYKQSELPYIIFMCQSFLPI